MDSGSLALYRRLDVASKTNKIIRFTDDVYDRIWSPIHFTAKELTTNQTINFDAGNYDYSPPQSVMDSAAEGYTTGYLNFTLNIQDSSEETYLYFYFAELEKQSNESRSFDIYFNGEYADGPYTPFNLKSSVVYPASPWPAADLKVSFKQTKDSTRPPLLNAMEIFLVRKLFQSETVQQDVTAVLNIKSKYKLAKDWQGDPCSPRKYVWDGLNCSYQDYDPPRIILLNLSSTGMTGEIANYILNLTMLEVLDLSNNSLSGSVPEFITQLSSLKVLNLAGNNFSGSVPDKLLERSKAGTLSLSIDEQNNCTSSSCQKKKKTSNIIVPIVAAVASIFVIIVAGVCIFLVVKRRKGQGSVTANKPDIQNQWMESKNRRFTYEDVLKITNNLETVIGEGGFGKVYLGYLDNQNKVAVKVLSVLARHGLQQFQAEVDLLMRVHHRNLTSLVGYCEEDNKIALIYEYMANGDLSKHLSEKRTSILSWEGRLKIAIEAAQGLEYLHHGCKPPIVHRDIKTANILLNNEFQAKIADFGLSKSFPTEVGTHVTTVVAGTPGYLDPQYHMTGQLTEKSDVYSFGVVLLNIITCRPVISQNNHVSKWVNSMLSGGDIQAIVDQRLHGNFDKNSAWKFVEIGMACVSESAAKRPTMNEVVIELKNCLDLEKSRRCEGMSTANESSLESFSMFVMHSGLTSEKLMGVNFVNDFFSNK
ncbi:hypothetical protein ACFE04_003920 [Oxalis oulophora]